jgi:hypothetical protein
MRAKPPIGVRTGFMFCLLVDTGPRRLGRTVAGRVLSHGLSGPSKARSGRLNRVKGLATLR